MFFRARAFDKYISISLYVSKILVTATESRTYKIRYIFSLTFLKTLSDFGLMCKIHGGTAEEVVGTSEHIQRHLVQSGTSIARTVAAIAGASLWEE